MKLRGISVSPGIAVGEAFVYEKHIISVLQEHIVPEELDAALQRYDACRRQVQKELEGLRDMMADRPQQAEIFSTHIDILFDEELDSEIRRMVKEELRSPDWAIQMAYARFAQLLGNSGSAVTASRAADLEDVCTHMLRCWNQQKGDLEVQLPHPTVLITRELSPSDVALLERDKVLAVVAELGGPASHSAILARCRGIPALFGVEGITSRVANGQTVLVDARQGFVLVQPDEAQAVAAKDTMLREARLAEEFRQELQTETRTADGQRIRMDVNIFSADVDRITILEHADGVGLFRTEFLYMQKAALPSEEEQFQAYRNVLRAMGERPVVLRTLDLGGDKPMEGLRLPREENPALGLRGIRLCLEHETLFMAQLRAALRASVYGKLSLMFPMVTGLEDIAAAKNMVKRVCDELETEGIPYGKDVKTGIMIETPAIALLADHAAREVDFASIGTNDLIQYICGADRADSAAAQYYQPCHPAVLRLIRFVAQAFDAAGKPLSVCGEMAADPMAAKLLLGCGIRSFSMIPDAFVPIKQMIRSLSMKEARQLADTVCGLSSTREVTLCLREAMTTREKQKEVSICIQRS